MTHTHAAEISCVSVCTSHFTTLSVLCSLSLSLYSVSHLLFLSFSLSEFVWALAFLSAKCCLACQIVASSSVMEETFRSHTNVFTHFTANQHCYTTLNVFIETFYYSSTSCNTHTTKTMSCHVCVCLTVLTAGDSNLSINLRTTHSTDEHCGKYPPFEESIGSHTHKYTIWHTPTFIQLLRVIVFNTVIVCNTSCKCL